MYIGGGLSHENFICKCDRDLICKFRDVSMSRVMVILKLDHKIGADSPEPVSPCTTNQQAGGPGWAGMKSCFYFFRVAKSC